MDPLLDTDVARRITCSLFSPRDKGRGALARSTAKYMREFGRAGNAMHYQEAVMVQTDRGPGFGMDSLSFRQAVIPFFTKISSDSNFGCGEEVSTQIEVGMVPISVYLPHVVVRGETAYLMDYNDSSFPTTSEEAVVDPLWGIRGLAVLKSFPLVRHLQIIYYQIFGETVSFRMSREGVESFCRTTLAPRLIVWDKQETRPGVFCIRCSNSPHCLAYKDMAATWSDIPVQEKSIIALLTQRSIMNGQRMELESKIWKLGQIIKDKVTNAGELTEGGARFYLEQVSKKKWDAAEVEDVLRSKDLWDPSVLMIYEPALNKIMEKHPEIMADLQRACLSTTTEFKLKGEAAGKARPLFKL